MQSKSQEIQKPAAMKMQPHPLQIGSVTLDNNILLAPMAGVTDLPFRTLCRRQGAGLVVTEMVSAKAVLYGNKNTESLLATSSEEQPAALQLFGSDPDIIASMAARLEEREFSVFDFNMGCPMPKITGNGEGSALMQNPALAGQIISSLTKSVNKPVTVKIRLGFDKDRKNAVEIAKRLEDAGAAAITVHGRTRDQYYTGEADWEAIARVKDAVSIPVIGNGDVTDGESALALLQTTGCDGLMIGRAARGNPWIFREVLSFLENGETVPPPTTAERVEMMRTHFQMEIACKGEYTGIREMRGHLSWYTAGLPDSAKWRQRMNAATEVSVVEALMDELKFP